MPIHILRGADWAMRGQPTGTAQPPNRGAPAPVYPISVNEAQRALAPVPIVDRFPFVVGQSLSATYAAATYRLATTGYRQQYVDLLDELLELDPQLQSVLGKRITSSANGRLEIVPAKLPKGHKDADRAKRIAEDCQTRVDRIPDLTQTIASQLWAVYNGLTASEIFWNRNSDGWSVDRFGFVHSRRLAYPDGQSWDLYIWDQGQVLGWNSPWGISKTNSGVFGLRVADYPGKFLIHAPQVRGDYPTRDGLGRPLAIWAIFKRIGARGAVAYLERFAKSFMDVVYNAPGDDGATAGQTPNPREASPEDIQLAKQIASQLGPGSGSEAVHPSSIVINPKSFDGGSSSKLTWPEWISICDAQMSKLVLGSTLGTDVGKGGGNRALGEVQERGEVDLEQYDATTFGQSFKRDVISWLVRLNFPGFEHLTPNVVVHVDTDPDPKPLVELAKGLTEIGAPVDLDALAEDVGIALVPNEEIGEDGKPKPRRAYLPDVTPPTSVDPDLMSAESKQAEQDQADADNAVAMQKAKQPPVMPGAPGAKGIEPAVKPGAGKATAKKTAKKTGKPAKAKTLTDRADAEAAIAIVFDDEGRILTVSRPEPPHEQSLPGGIVEDGETPEQAVIREIAEETGVSIESVHAVAHTHSPTDHRLVHVFVADRWHGDPKALEPNTIVRWMRPEALIAQADLYSATLEELQAYGALDPSAVEARLADDRHARWCLETIALSDRSDRGEAKAVYEQLLEDYPASSLDWILSAHWEGPVEIPIDEVDFPNQEKWRASHEPSEPYMERIEAGKRKPVVLVKTPGNQKFDIVDGHHRTLASKKLGIPVLAYVATMHVDKGPWLTLHGMQKKGSSKGSYSQSRI